MNMVRSENSHNLMNLVEKSKRSFKKLNMSSKHSKKENRPPVSNIKGEYKSSLSKDYNVRKRCNKPESETLENNVARTDADKSGCVIDLSEPGLCSALQLANKIQAASVGTSKVEELKLFQQKQLDEAAKQKAMKKTNVPFTKHIFKDLVDLQISDEEIHSGKSHHKHINFTSNKDPVFRLEDFYKPDFSTEVSVKVPDQTFEVEKIDYFNGFELYDKLESLKKLAKQ